MQTGQYKNIPPIVTAQIHVSLSSHF